MRPIDGRREWLSGERKAIVILILLIPLSWSPPFLFRIFAFVLGDNRDNSTDSRAMSATGFIPVENVVGRVSRIFWSMTADGDARVERVWQKVR